MFDGTEVCQYAATSVSSEAVGKQSWNNSPLSLITKPL